MVRFFLLLVACFFRLSQAIATPYEDALLALKNQYGAEVQAAGEITQWSESAYRLSFSDDTHDSPRQFVGRILRALNLQEETIESYLTSPAAHQTTPTNNLPAKIALGFVESQITKECRWCKSEEDWQVHRKAARAFMVAYDLEGVESKIAKSRHRFSGFPFYGDVLKSFSDPQFRKKAVEFESKLETLVTSLSGSGHLAQENVFAIALEICDGKREQAVALAGLLLSRDSNLIHFFNFLPDTDEAFVHAVGRIPLLVRLISSLDQVQRGSQTDRFSYDGQFETANVKNYYFWSGAFVAQKLARENFPSFIITELNLLFPRAYKSLRKVDDLRARAQAMITGQKALRLDAEDFKQDAIEVMKMTGRGSTMAIGPSHCDRLLTRYH